MLSQTHTDKRVKHPRPVHNTDDARDSITNLLCFMLTQIHQKNDKFNEQIHVIHVS